MNTRSRKTQVRELLTRRDFNALLQWAGNTRNPLRTLLSLTFDQDELIRWRTIEAVGKVSAMQAEVDLDKVRDLVRRLLWLMNDESGGLGWHSPELIAEILINVPVLIPEYAKLLPTYLREEPFERGTHLAIYRVALIDPRPFVGKISELVFSLNDSDSTIRGFAALALGVIEGKARRDLIEKLLDDHHQVIQYDFDAGELQQTTVAAMAKEAIGKACVVSRVE